VCVNVQTVDDRGFQVCRVHVHVHLHACVCEGVCL